MVLFSFKSISIIDILSLVIVIYPILGDECVDTVRWNDQMNNFTCSDYVTRGWCANKTFISSLQNNSLASLNFPDLNCCVCGKKESLKLPATARWDQNGITVAGAANGASGTSLDRLCENFGIYFAEDILYIADEENNRTVLIASNSTTAIRVIKEDPQSDMFNLNGPTDVFVTGTSIYVMDTNNFRVLKWSKNFSSPVTVAGIPGISGNSTNMATFSYAYNLFVDNYGNLFVGDYGNHRVLMFPWNSTSGTNATVVAGTGTRGSNAQELNGPSGVFVTDDGTLYIADTGNHRIQKWIIGERSGVTVAGKGVAGRGLSQLYLPYTISVDLNGYMYITDYGNDRIVRWALDARIGECVVGCSGYWGIGSSQLNRPTSITFDSNGSLYVNDYLNNRVQKFEILAETDQTSTSVPSTTTETTSSITMSLKLPVDGRWSENGITVAGATDGVNGTSLDRLYENTGIYFADDILYIADASNNRVVLIAANSTTAIAAAGGYSSNSLLDFNYPSDVFVTRTSIYVMDTNNFRVLKWSKDLYDPVTVAGIAGVQGNSTDMATFSYAYNLFVDNYDNLFVSDYDNHRVMMFPSNSTSGTNGTMVAGTGIRGSSASQLNAPSGMFVTDNRTLYIADSENHRIQKWIIGESSGVTVAGTGVAGDELSQLNSPYEVLVDTNGYMYIADFGNKRVVRWAPNINSGECIAVCPRSVQINPDQTKAPYSIAFDSNGALYVSDSSKNRVQKFALLNASETTSRRTTRSSTQSTFPASQNTTTIQTTTTMTHSKAAFIKSQFVITSLILVFFQISF